MSKNKEESQKVSEQISVQKKRGKSSIQRNFVYNILYQILIVAMPLITAPYVSRVLGAHNLGIYNYTFSVADYFMLFAMLGIKNYGNRQIATVRDNKDLLSRTFWNIYFLQIFSATLLMVLYLGYFAFFNVDNRMIVLIQGLHLLTAIVDISWFFFGIEEFRVTVVRNTIIKIVSLVLIFTLVKSPNDLWLYTLILSGSMFLGYVSVFPFLKRYVHFCKPTFQEMKKHIKPTLLLFLPVIAVSIFNVMDKIMLGRMSSYVQVGFYGNTDKLMRIPLGVITALGTVMMPHMAHMVASGDREKSKEVIENSMIFVMCMGCALAFGLAGVGRNFAPIFFGEEFKACGTLIIFLSPTILSLSWANVIRMQYLIPNKMDTEFTISTVIGAVVNVIVNALLIPHYGALGAIIGTVLAETSLTIYQTYTVRKFLPIGRFLRETLPFLFTGLVMCLVVNGLGNMLGQGIGVLLIQIVVGAILYIALVLLYFRYTHFEQVRKFGGVAWEYVRSCVKNVKAKFKKK